MIPKDVSPATTINQNNGNLTVPSIADDVSKTESKSIPTSTITNPYKKSGNMSGVSLSNGNNEEGTGDDEEVWTQEQLREEARRCIPLEEQRRHLDGYSYIIANELCEEKINQGKSSNSFSNKDSLGEAKCRW